jgi:hypothetical protein
LCIGRIGCSSLLASLAIFSSIDCFPHLMWHSVCIIFLPSVACFLFDKLFRRSCWILCSRLAFFASLFWSWTSGCWINLSLHN